MYVIEWKAPHFVLHNVLNFVDALSDCQQLPPSFRGLGWTRERALPTITRRTFFSFLSYPTSWVVWKDDSIVSSGFHATLPSERRCTWYLLPSPFVPWCVTMSPHTHTHTHPIKIMAFIKIGSKWCFLTIWYLWETNAQSRIITCLSSSTISKSFRT